MTSEKKVIWGMITGFLGVGLLSWFPQPEVIDIIRFGFNCILCWYLYRGANWARWTMGILAAVAFVMLINPIIYLPYLPQWEARLMVTFLALFYGTVAFLLISKKFIAAHFDRQGA